MAMSVGRRAGPVADINVTPMADVVYVRADQGLLYERVGAVLALCRGAGAETVELMTAPEAR